MAKLYLLAAIAICSKTKHIGKAVASHRCNRMHYSPDLMAHILATTDTCKKLAHAAT